MFLLSTQGAWAQIMFQRQYGGTADDYGSRVIQTGDGGYFVAAITESYGVGYSDIYLIRTNELGDTLWTKTIGGTGDEQPNAMKTTMDNNYIIAGSTDSYGAGNRDVYLIKVDQSGATLWAKTFGGTLDDVGYDVIQTSDGGYLVVGTTPMNTSGYTSLYVIKTNSSGDSLWTKAYQKKDVNTGLSVVQLADGGFFIIGETLQYGLSNTADCYFIRTNMIGDTIWTKTIGGSGLDGAFQVLETGDNNLIISGSTTSYGAGGIDIFLSMFDSNGNELWMKTFGGANDDYGGAFSPTDDGGYIISGYTESYGVWSRDMYLIKTDNYGDTLWTKTFDSGGDEWGGCVKQTSDKGYIISGNTSIFGNGDVFLVKTNPEGISGLPQIIPQNIQYEVYPNPGNGQFNIEFEDPNSTAVKVEVFDRAGKLVFEKNGTRCQGNVYPLSLAGFPSGSYLLQVTTSKGCAVTKLVIQK